jgi:hypothetical protein
MKTPNPIDSAKELSEYELNTLLPALIAGFSTKTIDNTIHADDIVKALTAKEYKITPRRLRKCVNYIRTNSLLPLMGNVNGFYCSNNTEEIQKQIASLNASASTYLKAADGLKKFITQ